MMKKQLLWLALLVGVVAAAATTNTFSTAASRISGAGLAATGTLLAAATAGPTNATATEPTISPAPSNNAPSPAKRAPGASTALEPSPIQARAAAMTADLLTRYHYKPQALDDAMSQKMFDRYLKALDPEKIFFIQSDIDGFAADRTILDDAIKTQNLTAPFAMFNLYLRRLQERMVYARSLLAQGFDFAQQETYPLQRKDAAWAPTTEAVQDLWRKRVKNDWLRLKLAGKDEKAIRETLQKRYDYALTRFKKLKSEDAFDLFMNAYAMSVEPHTNYLGPKATEDFDISMRLSLVGIGAVLQERDDMTVIRELVPGGPAALSGKLNVGDRIVGVGQGSEAPPTDVLGWRLDDVVRLIRGTEGTTVKLNVLAASANTDAPAQAINLVRKKISLEQQAAKKSIIEVKDGEQVKRIGVITLPTFYQDFEARSKGEKNFKSATRDVANLLAELKASKVDSVLIDLRNNGGGSLTEAVDLTNLFVGGGPVVQQRDSRGSVRVEGNKTAPVAWDGQLGVLINRNSASASEIFAAAMQDYGRALIIGEPSFGKGTVQTVINLNSAARNDTPKLGEVKMTIAQFYRVNGGTTQLRGVVPDIKFPGYADPDSGESGFDNALPWGQIKPADYAPVGDLSDIAPLLQMKHDKRIESDPEFRFLQEDIAEYAQRQKDKSLSLNETVRRAERDARDAKIKAREKVLLQANAASGASAAKAPDAAQDDGLQADERSLTSDIAAEKARKVAKDVFLIEAAHVLADELGLIQSSTRLAQQVLSGFGRLKADTAETAR